MNLFQKSKPDEQISLVDPLRDIQTKEQVVDFNEKKILNQATWFSCYSNLTRYLSIFRKDFKVQFSISTIIGAGVLGLPFALSRTGFVLGIFLLCLFGTLSCFGLHLLSVCAKRCPPPSSFHSVAELAMPRWSHLIDLAVFIKCYGVAISYLIVIGDLMPKALENLGASYFWTNRKIWVFLGWSIVAPLSCFQSLDALKTTSSLSIVFVFFLTILVILYYFHAGDLDPCADVSVGEQCRGPRVSAQFDLHSIRSLSVFIFAYTCQQNTFSVVNELHTPTQPRVDSVFLGSIGTALVIYLLAACFGYATYGDMVLSDLLKTYPQSSSTSAARIFVSLIVAFHYPLQCNPARKCMLSMLEDWGQDKRKKQLNNEEGPGGGQTASGTDERGNFVYHNEEEGERDSEDPSLPSSPCSSLFCGLSLHSMRYVTITAFFLGTSLLIALYVEDLGVMLSLVGATGSALVSYILPGSFYYYIFSDPRHSLSAPQPLANQFQKTIPTETQTERETEDWTLPPPLPEPSWKRHVALCQCGLGLVIMPLCLTIIFMYM